MCAGDRHVARALSSFRPSGVAALLASPHHVSRCRSFTIPAGSPVGSLLKGFSYLYAPLSYAHVRHNVAGRLGDEGPNHHDQSGVLGLMRDFLNFFILSFARRGAGIDRVADGRAAEAERVLAPSRSAPRRGFELGERVGVVELEDQRHLRRRTSRAPASRKPSGAA